MINRITTTVRMLTPAAAIGNIGTSCSFERLPASSRFRRRESLR
jgi:hypothetical protein